MEPVSSKLPFRIIRKFYLHILPYQKINVPTGCFQVLRIFSEPASTLVYIEAFVDCVATDRVMEIWFLNSNKEIQFESGTNYLGYVQPAGYKLPMYVFGK